MVPTIFPIQIVNFKKGKFRYFNFEPSLKLQWCRARDFFRLQIPVTTGGFELRISSIRGSY